VRINTSRLLPILTGFR